MQSKSVQIELTGDEALVREPATSTSCRSRFTGHARKLCQSLGLFGGHMRSVLHSKRCRHGCCHYPITHCDHGLVFSR
jgi:hypothetical protein